MDDKKGKKKQLICSICARKILKKPNKLDKPYAVRSVDPIICDRCIIDLTNIFDEDQELLGEQISLENIKETAKSSGSSECEKPGLSCQNVHDINLMDLILKVKSVIKGQDEHVKKICTAIYKNQIIDETEIKSNVLILGETGSGKSEIIKLLAGEFKTPYFFEDATRYSEVGYFGASIDDMIRNLYMAAGRNIERAQKGILIIDEGDKKESSDNSGRDVSGKNVLFSLLKIAEGTKAPITDKNGGTIGYLDTSMLTIIFIGAFPELSGIRKKRLKQKGNIGFTNEEVDDINIIKDYTAKDFEDAGFPKEFVARFDTVVELNKLTIENLADIIRNSEKSTFVKYVKLLEGLGLKLTYSDDVIDEIAMEAEKLNIGARSIKKIVQYMFGDIIFQMFTDDKKYTECVITKEIVHDPTNYTMI